MKKNLAAVSVAILVFGFFIVPSTALAKKAKKAEEICSDPIAAVLATMHCFINGDTRCIANSYSDDFVLIHNGTPTDTNPHNELYWKYAFMYSDFTIDINHLMQIEEDRVSARYIERLDFVNGKTIYQHEHALITVDKDCKIKLWDQYGDSTEQEVMIATLRAILCQKLKVCD